MSTAQELAGKVALVTGGAKNIGRATAKELAAAGAKVAVNTAKSRAEADSVVQEIRAAGGDAEVYMADISKAAEVKGMVDAIMKRYGRVDFLILNASVRTERPFLELSYEEWRTPLSITLDGAFYLAQACIPSMIANGGGSIVTLGGMMSLSGAKKRIHGSVAKHGLVGFTRGIAREFGEKGIRANLVAPGQMNTTRAAGRTPHAGNALVPLGRQGEAEEIATVVRFLCGPGSSYVSGQSLQINGGQMMF